MKTRVLHTSNDGNMVSGVCECSIGQTTPLTPVVNNFEEAHLPLTLQTPRLTIARSTPADCADFISLERDPRVMRFLNGGKPVDRAAMAGSDEFAMPDGTEPEVWTIRFREDHSFVGWVGLWKDAPTPGKHPAVKSGELGYRLAHDHWCKGIASEAARALINWGFETQGFDRISANATAANFGSRRVMEKAGMRFSRAYHYDWAVPFEGSEHGDVEYIIMRDEWLRR
jgi:RimJ/RimL family protein N-acetyltransferase